MPYYIVKKKSEKRWTAYELEKRPILKRGYEMKGPYENLVKAFMAANKDNTSPPKEGATP